MGKRDDLYQLSPYVEMAEGFIDGVDDKEVIAEKKDQFVNEETKPKRGRGSERQTKVLVMVESKPIGKEANKRQSEIGQTISLGKPNDQQCQKDTAGHTSQLHQQQVYAKLPG